MDEQLTLNDADGANVGSMPADASGAPSCEHCGTAFKPRKGTGGRPQRFCSTECRTAFHTEAQRGQRGPTCSAQTTLPAVQQPPAVSPTPQDQDGEDFNWARDEDIVIRSQPAIAVYWNPRREVVIRRECECDEDQFVYVQPSFLPALIARLQVMLKEAG